MIGEKKLEFTVQTPIYKKAMEQMKIESAHLAVRGMDS
jgi:hypothetical protein